MGRFLACLHQRSAVVCAALLVSAAPQAPSLDMLVAPDGSLQEALDAALHATENLRHHVRLEGTVLLPGGGPARGAVVVSSAGGQAAVRADGSFSLEIAVEPPALAVELTAVADGPGGLLIARRQLDGLGDGPIRRAGTLVLAQSQGCLPDWIPTFGGMPGTDNTVHALTAFDDGSGAGPSLYAGGTFFTAGGKAVNGVARWDGKNWSDVGRGVLIGSVRALKVFDDGSGAGPALHAAGWFTTAGGESANSIAKWDGQNWSALGSGMSLATVHALTVFNDGSGAGPGLYAGGDFTSAGGQSANRIARWDGQRWSALGSGVSGAGSQTAVYALTVFDDGSGTGPALYAGGSFTTAGGQGANRIAKWNGQSWSALGSAMNNSIKALTVFDDGSGAGPALYAGGEFTTAGGQSARRIARWDGQSWSPLGNGMNGSVHALTVFEGGSGAGPALHAGGEFSRAGGQGAGYIARWDGQSWSALGSGVSGAGSLTSVYALAVFGDGSGAGLALYAGGWFDTAGGQGVSRIARWDGQSWRALGGGVNDIVLALAAFDDGSGGGPALYAAGEFTGAPGLLASRIAKWDGQSWSTVGSGMSDFVHALTVFDDGSGAGPALYAGGSFTSADGLSANRIARWDGQSWSALSSGMNGPVYALTVFDDGSGAGPALYAAGAFSIAGDQSAERIARWDGQSWSALGSGMNDVAQALAVFDDGSGAGPALYAGGSFTISGGLTVNRIAKWDGLSWSALSSGMNLTVSDLTVFDDGSGSALYAGGTFKIAGGLPADGIAKWDGQSWSALGSGVKDYSVYALCAFDDGTGAGAALYVGGWFTSAGGLSANSIARWDGQGWRALGNGVNEPVYALTVFDDGSGAGPALYAGGSFTISPGGDSYLAKWSCSATDRLVGCLDNPATLAALSSQASIGGAFDVSLSSSQVATGLGLLYLGADGTSAAGCGWFAPGLGELLLALAPPPQQVGSGLLSARAVGFVLPVPNQPALVGVKVAFQGVVVGLLDPRLPIELSNALLVTITQ